MALVRSLATIVQCLNRRTLKRPGNLMHILEKILHSIAENSKWMLILGLLTGIFVPPLADSVKPWIGYCVALLLFLAALRIDPKDALGTKRDYRHTGLFIAVIQLLVPCLVAGFFLGFGFDGPLAVALLIAFASAPISGSPGLTIITGNDPAPALRFLIASTALLPLTVFLPFTMMPILGDPLEVTWIALRLFFIIAVASLLAFSVRHFFLRNPSDETLKSVDGLTALAMGAVVIGLMTGFGDAALSQPAEIFATLLIAFTACIGMQMLVWFSITIFDLGNARAAFAICSGNRNMAIFLAALPAAVTDPILLFIACYQIPMYLTPTLLGWMYERSAN